MKILHLSILTVFFMALHLSLNGQRPPAGMDRGRGESDSPFEGQDAESTLDTFGVFIFDMDAPGKETAFSDSLLGNYFQHYNPLQKRDFDKSNLGNFGSAHHAITYLPANRKGFEVGFNQYDAYQLKATDLPFYRLEKPYTQLGYTIGGLQSNEYFTSKFSRNFANGLNLSLNYKKMSQLGTQEQYPNQNVRNTSLSTGMWYHGKGGRYDGFFAIANNTIEQEDNGGVAEEPVLGEEFETPASAIVFLQAGQTQYRKKEWSYTHYYQLRKLTEQNQRAYTLKHRIRHENNAYKFSHEFYLADTLFYNRFPNLFSDIRGNRYFIGHRKTENSFFVSTLKNQDPSKENEARQERDRLEIGITHAYNKVNLEPIDTVINNLFLNGEWLLNPGRWQLHLKGHLGLWDNAGDYQVNGTLYLDLKKLGTIRFTANNQLYEPNLIQNRFFLNQKSYWDNKFKKTLESNLGAIYAFPGNFFEIRGGYNLINNYIYYDQQGLPQQTGVPISILQMSAKLNVHLGPVYLDNVISLQKTTEGFIRLPELYSKHSLYYTGRWFKVLNIRLGLDLRINSAYYSEYYNPIVGQFQLQDDFEVLPYPAVDGWLSIQVTKLRAFVKWDNLTGFLIKDELYYQSAYYPATLPGLRMGIDWRFVN